MASAGTDFLYVHQHSLLSPQTLSLALATMKPPLTPCQSYLAAALAVPIFLWVPCKRKSGSAGANTRGNTTFAPYFYPSKK